MKRLFFIFALMTIALSLTAQALNDYRSVGSGAWNTLSTWEYWNGSAWVTPTVIPTNSSNNILIRAPHIVTVLINVAADQLIVEPGATLTISSGNFTVNNGAPTPDVWVYGTLRITNTGAVTSTSATLWIDGTCEFDRNGGNLPLATWRSGSTLEIIGLTTTLPGNRTQTFHNLTWNCPNQSANLNPTGTSFRVINGLFKVVSTGTGILTWTSSNTNTKTLGAWEQTGGTVRMTDGAANIVVHLNGDFTMSGGLLTETGTATGCGWIFQGAGHQTFYKTGGTISETISFTVNNGSVMDVADQPLVSGGSFTLSYGGSLHSRSPQGITLSGSTGSIQVTGTRSYNTGAYYNYEGITAQVTGDGLPSEIAGLTIDNPSGVTLTNPVQVVGTTSILSGDLSGSFETDGFYSPATYYLEITETGELINGFSVSVSTPLLFPAYVNRRWNLSGSYNGYKTITFWWDENDDLAYDWIGLNAAPAAFNGVQMYPGWYDVSMDPRWLSVDVESSLSKALWTIGRDDEQTLPIELSSFTATATAQNTVMLSWVTQSETNAAGFYIYRSAVNDLKDALRVSPLINATNSSAQTVYRFEDADVESGLWYYWLQNVDLSGDAVFHGPISYSITLPPEGSMPPIPVYTKLQAIFPNPFNPLVNITYSIADPVPVRFDIYTIRGQLVRSYDQGFRGKGNYHFSWDGRDSNGTASPSGLYLIRMTAGSKVSTAKALLKK